MSEDNFESEVWMYKKTGDLYEHFFSFFGPALTKFDLEHSKIKFTNWEDFIKRRLFAFDDCALYNKNNFINLGKL